LDPKKQVVLTKNEVVLRFSRQKTRTLLTMNTENIYHQIGYILPQTKVTLTTQEGNTYHKIRRLDNPVASHHFERENLTFWGCYNTTPLFAVSSPNFVL